MPTSAYSEYKDPETGKITRIPDLTSDDISMSSQEIEFWLKSRAVPQRRSPHTTGEPRPTTSLKHLT